MLSLSQRDPPFAHEVALPANRHVRDVWSVQLDLHLHQTGTSHLKALFTDHLTAPHFGREHQSVAHEITAQRATGGTGCWIFGDAHRWGKHATMHRRIGANHFLREDEDMGAAKSRSTRSHSSNRKRMARMASKLLTGTKRKGTPHDTTSSGRVVSSKAGSRESIWAIASRSANTGPNVGSG